MRELAAIVGHEHVEVAVRVGDTARTGRARARVRPADVEEVAAVVSWCYEHDLAVVPVGGGSGYAGGAAPLDAEAVAVSLDRLSAMRSFDPGLWRMEAEAGMTTETVARRARESGLLFPPDPGAGEQSQLGGTIATNAGGPHAFKYGVTGDWVTGLEAVLAPGEIVRVGGPVRKDVAGYDLRALLTGSEGTLGVVTAAWLRLVPAPEAQLPIAAAFEDVGAGCAAIERVLASGEVPAAIEYLDEATMEAAGGSLPEEPARALGMSRPSGSGGASSAANGRAPFVLLLEADGARQEALRVRDALLDALHEGEGLLGLTAPEAPGDVRALWHWRAGVSHAVTARRGAKLSEDVAVPLDRLREAIEGTLRIGERHGLPACSWGHAGDGNLHSTFLLAADHPGERERADAAAHDLFALALALGGTVTGEHGIGVLKAGQLRHQWTPAAVAAHRAIKAALDPKGLLNPGKKLP
ncbi:MAG TPA: FAD-linked oxidase C-terminal domain-containing protein [Solirubrobacteraceae bacterium]|nr:FAD-linked oxidase C-terminal domain-containing protein [Solirubrobacteraceae bacterium]